MKENRKENVVLANYKVESEAYQALSELKRDTANANYTISYLLTHPWDAFRLFANSLRANLSAWPSAGGINFKDRAGQEV